MSLLGEWNDLPREPHIMRAQDDLRPQTRKMDGMLGKLPAYELAQWIERGLVDGWPLEFTRKGWAWWHRVASPETKRRLT